MTKMNYYDHAKEIHLTNSHRVLAFVATMQTDLDTKDITISRLKEDNNDLHDADKRNTSLILKQVDEITRLKKEIDYLNFTSQDFKTIDLGDELPGLLRKQACDEIDLTKGSE